MKNSPRIFVTGGAGYVGSVLIPLLLRKGYEVICYDLLLHGAQSLLANASHPNFTLIKGDILDSAALKQAMVDVDYIIHLASIVGAPACAQNPVYAERVNVAGTKVLNDVRGDIPVIFSSTGSVYGQVEGICTEETPVAPLSDYGRHKAEGEKIFLSTGNAVILRFATAYGLSPRLRLDLLPNDFTYQAIHNRRIEIYEAGFKRTFIHVRDLARALIHAVDEFYQMQGQVFNVGDESMNMTKLELAVMIQRMVNFNLISGKGSDPDARNYEVSYQKIRATGYRTVVPMDQGIAEMCRIFPSLDRESAFGNVPV
jgi:nucleoside-diphosphate-sugar epimerase